MTTIDIIYMLVLVFAVNGGNFIQINIGTFR